MDKIFKTTFWVFIITFFVSNNVDLLAQTEGYIPPPKLPAYKTPSEKMRLRSQLYDFRSSNIDLYKITQPPSIPISAVAEFEPASILLLAYFPGYYDNVYKGIITAVIDKVKIYFFYNSNSMKNAILNKMRSWGISQSQIDSCCVFVNTELDSVWIRDSGPNPIVTQDQKYGIVDFRYYIDRYYDDKIPTELGLLLDLNVFRPSMDYEGGNFMTNGKGLCMVTKGSIWENLPMIDYDVRKILKNYMGCEKTVFLKPLSGEGTMHIDMFAKFTSEDTILLGKYEFSQDCINYDVLEENYATLLNTTTVDGKSLKIVRIPMPDNTDGVWRSYTNSLLVNNIALVPVYSGDRRYEAEALSAYRTALGQGWTIVPIDSEEIIPDGGAIHCITMTVPDFSLVKFQNDPAALCGNSTKCEPGGCGSITTKGNCDGDIVIWCDNNVPYYYDCASPCNMVPNGYPCKQKCEYNSQKGYYDCGSDYICYQCVDECSLQEVGCVDNTTAWYCAGDIDNDGCNERKTFSCDAGDVCKNGICETDCQPECTGKVCGDDGCGGKCGDCSPDEYCGVDYQCHKRPFDAGYDISSDSQIDDTPIFDTYSDFGVQDDGTLDIFDANIEDDTYADAGLDIFTDIKIVDTIEDENIFYDVGTTDAISQDTKLSNDVVKLDVIEEQDRIDDNLIDNSGCSCSNLNL